MKTVYFMRHAKSDWSDPELDDFDRPLNARGQAAAKKMAAYFKELQPDLNLALVSTAKRTRETWDAVQQGLGDAAPAADHRISLYLATAQTLIGALRELDKRVNRVLIVGHNPGISEICSVMAKPDQTREAKDQLVQIHYKFPTGAFAKFEFDIDDWNALEMSSGALIMFATPKSV